jgi:hypothetical protein
VDDSPFGQNNQESGRNTWNRVELSGAPLDFPTLTSASANFQDHLYCMHGSMRARSL